MRISGWKLFKVCHQANNPCDYKHCDSVDIMFLMCHRTSGEDTLKSLCEFLVGSVSQRFTTLSCLVAIGVVKVEI